MEGLPGESGRCYGVVESVWEELKTQLNFLEDFNVFVEMGRDVCLGSVEIILLLQVPRLNWILNFLYVFLHVMRDGGGVCVYNN